MFHEITKNGVPFLVSDLLSVPHGFSGKRGGVSRGIYESLNLRVHCDDDPERIAENYRRLYEAVGVTGPAVFTHQVHGDTVLPVMESDRHELFTDVPYAADGLITKEPGLPLIAFSADCIPILLHDPVQNAVAAVHAGWRGTAFGIAEKAVRKMTACFGSRPADVRAAIGPGIGPCCFETGPEVPAALYQALGQDAEEVIRPAGEKAFADLKKANLLFLLRAGLLPEQVDLCPVCTRCSHALYWSHRQTLGERGVQGAIISL